MVSFFNERTINCSCVSLLDVRSWFKLQAKHLEQKKRKKYVLKRLPFSRFLAKNPRVNTIFMISFSKI